MTPGVVAVLTNGLTCGLTGPCQGGTLLTAGPFSLYCPTEPVIPKTPDISEGGGGASNIGWIGPSHNVSTNINNPANQILVTNPHRHLGRNVPITIKFKLGNIERDKLYMVDIRKRDVILKVGKIIHTIDNKIRVSVSSLRKRTHNIRVRVSEGRLFRNKKDV